MERSKIQQILDDIEKYENYNFNQDVVERLEKSLSLYLSELDSSYLRLKDKDTNYIMRELSK